MAPAPMTARFATARVTWAPSPTSVSVRVTSGPTTASAPMLVAPSSWVPGSTVVSWPMLTSTSIQVVAGSTMVTPARMCALADPAVELTTDGRQLHAVVDALGLPEVVEHVGAHRVVAGPGDGDDVGEVLLALRVVGADVGQRVAQHVGVEGVDAGVDLGERALGVGGVLVLDDLLDPPAVAAHDPAVARRVGEVGGDDRHRTAALGVGPGELDQGGAGEQRHVAAGDQHGAGEVGGQGQQAALDGPAGALDGVLVGEDEVGVDRGAHRRRPGRARGARRRPRARRRWPARPGWRGRPG